MQLEREERRIKSAMPALQLAWLVVYFPMLSGGVHPLLFVCGVAILSTLLACARRVRLTTERVLVDRPLFSWLGWFRGGSEGVDAHRLRDLTHAEAEDNTLVLVYRSGLRARIHPDFDGAEAFAEAVNERIAELVSEQVKVSVRPARAVSAVGVRASAAGATLRCPYCHDDLVTFQATACSGCSTLHHGECLSEHGRCAILGCAGRPRRVAA